MIDYLPCTQTSSRLYILIVFSLFPSLHFGLFPVPSVDCELRECANDGSHGRWDIFVFTFESEEQIRSSARYWGCCCVEDS